MNSVIFRIVLTLWCMVPSASLWASQGWVSLAGNGTLLAPLEAPWSWTSIRTGVPAIRTVDAAAHPTAERNRLWVLGLGTSTARSDLVAVNPRRELLLSRVELIAPEPIVTLAIDPTDGGFCGTSEEALYRIDPRTGATTVVGATSLGVDTGLGFDMHGNLYGIANQNQLVEIDKRTAATSLISVLDVIRMEDIAARPEDGLMYGIAQRSGYRLFRMDLATGDLVDLGDSVARPSGLAFVAVPEPSTRILAVVAMLLVAGTRAARRL
jgi:hypothetical protein